MRRPSGHSTKKQQHRRPQYNAWLISLCAGMFVPSGVLCFQICRDFPHSSAAFCAAAGISFYTFQTLCYVFDIYAGGLCRRGIRWLLRHYSHSFFTPQLVRGAIETQSRLASLPQLRAQEAPYWTAAVAFGWCDLALQRKLCWQSTADVLWILGCMPAQTEASRPGSFCWQTLLFAPGYDLTGDF